LNNCPRLLQQRFWWYPLQDRWFTNSLLERSNQGPDNIKASVLMTVAPLGIAFQTSDVSRHVLSYPVVSAEVQKDTNTFTACVYTPHDSVDGAHSSCDDRPIPAHRSRRFDENSEHSTNHSPQSSDSIATASDQTHDGSGDVGPTQQLQRRHIKEGRKKHRCTECSQSYDHRKNLRDHVRSRHTDYRYECPLEGCRESVAHQKNLRRHMAAKHGSYINNKTTLSRVTQPP